MPSPRKYRLIADLARFLLIMLWTYAVAAKMQDFSRYAYEMKQQVFSIPVATFLAYALPATELIAVILLMVDTTIPAGLIFSASLLFAFCAYSVAVLLRWFPRTPCPCGGLISELSWTGHVTLNISFLLLTLITICLHNRERRLKSN